MQWDRAALKVGHIITINKVLLASRDMAGHSEPGELFAELHVNKTAPLLPPVLLLLLLELPAQIKLSLNPVVCNCTGLFPTNTKLL